MGGSSGRGVSLPLDLIQKDKILHLLLYGEGGTQRKKLHLEFELWLREGGRKRRSSGIFLAIDTFENRGPKVLYPYPLANFDIFLVKHKRNARSHPQRET